MFENLNFPLTADLAPTQYKGIVLTILTQRMRTDTYTRSMQPVLSLRQLTMMSSAAYEKGFNTRTTNFYSESVSKTNEKKIKPKLVNGF